MGDMRCIYGIGSFSTNIDTGGMGVHMYIRGRERNSINRIPGPGCIFSWWTCSYLRVILMALV